MEIEVNCDKIKFEVFWGVFFINLIVYYKDQEIVVVKYCKIQIED